MHFTNIVAVAASLSSAAALTQGFNYGATQRDGTIKVQSDFEAEFKTAKALAGTNGAFSSARLYTTVQGGTQNTPISAIPAAIAQGTNILLGMWASSGQTQIDSEIAALKSAISTYGTKFTSLVTGLSVGSEDLYRITPTSLSNDPNSVGAGPDAIVTYIKSVRKALAGTALSGVKIGHVDTWTAWVNGSNSAVAAECDWVGMNTFPYFQTTVSNSIDDASSLFNEAFAATKGAVGGKEVWVTESGWPVGGKQSNLASASTTNARKYYVDVGCNTLFQKTPTFWYTLVDANTDPNQPQFGVVGTKLSSTPLFELSCPAVSSTSSKAASSTKAASSGAASGTGIIAVSTVSSPGSQGTGVIAAPTGFSNGTATTGSPAGASVTASRSSIAGGAMQTGSVVGALGAVLAVMAAL